MRFNCGFITGTVINMALTQLQKLELNKRVDKILHAPANAPAGGQQPEIAFVADMTGDPEYIHSAIKDAAAALKAHDKLFQNVRSNMVYWGNDLVTEVMPMSLIQIGRAFVETNVDNHPYNVNNLHCFEELCGYLKLFHARCRCILLFTDCTYEMLRLSRFKANDEKKAIENLNPFLKYRLLVITRDKMTAGSEIMMNLLTLSSLY